MVIGPGIYLNSLDNAMSELLMTRDASPAGNHADGFCGYSYRVPYVSGTWSGFSPSLVSQVTPTWADVPDMPWKSAPTKDHIMGTVPLAGTGVWADFSTVSVSGPASRSMYVDGTGFYAFIDLPPGSYTVTASTGTTIQTYADPAFLTNIAPLGVNTTLNLLGGISVGSSGNDFRLYNLTPTVTNGPPAFITSTNFPTDNDNSVSGTGAVDFGADRVYALCSNNGIIAMQLTHPAPD